MKKIPLLIFFVAAFSLYSQELSGILDSTVNYSYTDASPCNSFGLEEYANLRLKIPAGEKVTVYAAFNAAAVAGNYLSNAAALAGTYPVPFNGSTSFIYGNNYAAALELERLYFRVNGDYIDAEAGLLRLNFGYGQVWGSSDFLNSHNPFSSNARPRGILGGDFSFYPTDTLKLLFFTAAPSDPLESGGGGFIPGFTLDQHWDFASLQFLYSYQTPLAGSGYGLHRFGLSIKGDIAVGMVTDMLYTLNPASSDGIDGLSASAGFDYSFAGGDFYTLWEYLYNGSASSTSLNGTGVLQNHHYLYGSILYRINDYTRTGFSTIYCFDSPSFSHSIYAEYDIYQGLTLNLNARIPMDLNFINGVREGELGPARTGTRITAELGARLRF